MSESRKVVPYRRLNGVYLWITIVFTCLAVVLGVIKVSGIIFGGYLIIEQAFLSLLLGLLAPLVFLLYPATKRSPRDRVPWYDVVLAFATFTPLTYGFILADTIHLQGWTVLVPWHLTLLAVIGSLCAVEAARRSGGWPLMGLVVLFMTYPLFGHWLPGMLRISEHPLPRIGAVYFFSSAGVLGSLARVFATLLLGYMVFAATLEFSGAGRLFVNIALKLLGKFRGGPAKMAVLSSALFGTVSGQAAANCAAMGGFTIPLMKSLGYPSHWAGAVEACASTGGVLMPPVMGSVAFLMAELLQIPYAEICLAAIVPIGLYYYSLLIQVDAYAGARKWTGLPASAIPSWKKALSEGWYCVIGLGVLVYFLFVRASAERAPYYASAVILVAGLVFKGIKPSWPNFRDWLLSIAAVLAQLAGFSLVIGIIMASFSITGLSSGTSNIILQISGGNLLIIALLSAAFSFVLGMGLSILPCYIFLIVTIGPALTRLGLSPVATHLFMIYWGMVSFITPPVALASQVAAGIAGADPWKTGWTAVRLGALLYVVPFLFLFNTSLIGQGPVLQILLNIIVVMAGLTLVCSAIEGYFWGLGKFGQRRVVRFALVAVAGFLFYVAGANLIRLP